VIVYILRKERRMLGRMMAIDYGLKRIGIALTDPLQITISPLDTIASISPKQNAQTILNLAIDKEVSKIVIGLPVNMSGSEGAMGTIVRDFASEIGKLTKIPIAFVNECLSTIEAKDLLIDKGEKLNYKDKGRKDKIAAALIGQRYLEQKCAI
jgi:putative Holliday junction resolvase